MGEKRQIQFERYTNLPLGGNWAGEWPAYVLVHHEGAVDDVRYVPERTCHLIHEVEEEDDEFFDTVERHYYVCSECGSANRMDARYCDWCGARVIEEES